MDDGSWALAVSLGHVRNAVVAFVAAEDPSGASLFLAADCLEVEGLFADLGVEPEPVDPSVDAGADRVGGLLAAWPRLATAALRVLDAVTVEPAWLDDAGSVREVLAEVVRRPPLPPFDDSVTGRVVPDGSILAVATRLGMVADLLAGQPPARSMVDRAALAVAALGALDGERDVQSSRWLLRGVLVRTERFAVLPPQQRSGR